MLDYCAPRWLPGGHAQTIWPALFSRPHEGARMPYRRERWTTPDQDFIDVDWIDADAQAPLLVLLHGLEGSSGSHYALAFAHWARQQGWRYAVPHFRGCSGEPNRAPRAYHSGDVAEIDWMLKTLRASHRGPLAVVAVSLGGNALMRWAGEVAGAARPWVQALAAISAPLDLRAGATAIDQGLNRRLYTRMFLQTLKPKALQKWEQHPGLFARQALQQVRRIREFDEVFTAPVHGFESADDYYARASAKPHLRQVAVPALLLNARNDPFVPAHSLPQAGEVSPSVTLWQPETGGHAGFAHGAWPGSLQMLPQRVGRWLAQQGIGVPDAAGQQHG